MEMDFLGSPKELNKYEKPNKPMCIFYFRFVLVGSEGLF